MDLEKSKESKTVVINESLGRRQSVPVIYARGTHYEVGFDVGRTFSSLIKSSIASNERLKQFEKEYETENGKKAYDITLNNMTKRFPQYVHEVQGIADGSEVSFDQLFLLHMDDIIETINTNSCVCEKDNGGCSSVGVNEMKACLLGHTEDAYCENLNHFYILSAYVTPDEEDRKQGATRKENFTALCYAGQLPGYAMGYTGHGVVFSINTLSPKELKAGATPRTFLARALLTAHNINETERILKDEGLGVANGFSVNMIWTNPNGERLLYNIEVAPDLSANRSILNVEKFGEKKDALIHCNRYERLKVSEVDGAIIDSSSARLAALRGFPSPRDINDIINMLSDKSGPDYCVFQDGEVKTIAAGIFDLDRNIWFIYIDTPNTSEPVAIIPITFSMLE